MAFQFRDTSQAKMEALEAIVHEETEAAAKRARATVEVTRVLATLPTPMDEGLQRIITAAADSLGVKHETMPSGAGHDCQIMARACKTAMIFVQSKDGRSHTPDEYSTPEHLAAGVQLLAAALHRLAY